MLLRVLTYNVHKGFSLGLRFTLHEIKKAIQTTEADIVFLQEILGEHTGHAAKVKQWPEQSQFEFLADGVWPHFSYGKNAVYPKGHHGNAILSRYPIVSEENIDISTTPLASRGMLHAVIEVPVVKDPMHVICLHLDLHKKGRELQQERIVERVAESVPKNGPFVMAGDFNDWSTRLSEGFEKRLLVEEAFAKLNGRYAKTFPLPLPTLSLDRVYFRNLEAVSVSCLKSAPWNKLSDHAPLLVEFEL